MSNGYISTCRFTSWFWSWTLSTGLKPKTPTCRMACSRCRTRTTLYCKNASMFEDLGEFQWWLNQKASMSRIVSTKGYSFKSPCPAWKKNNFLPRHRMLPTCQMRIQHQWWPDWQLWRHPYRCQGVAVLTYFPWGSRFGAWISQIHRCLYIVVYLYPTKNLWFHLWHHSDAGRLCQVTTLGGCAIGRYCRGTLPGGKKVGDSADRIVYDMCLSDDCNCKY